MNEWLEPLSALKRRGGFEEFDKTLFSIALFNLNKLLTTRVEECLWTVSKSPPVP